MKSLVLLSGGQDSTTCLFWAKTMFPEVYALALNYGQKHAVEIECARKIAALANVPFWTVDIAGAFTGSALVDWSLPVSGAHAINPELPATFTAGRNAVFLAIAAGIAFNSRIDTIITGVCQTDFSGYPDCREVFVRAQEAALRLALDWPELKIVTPLMYMSKAETWRMAQTLGILDIIVEETNTDYNGARDTLHEWGYGELDNPATELRAKGYFEAKQNGWI